MTKECWTLASGYKMPNIGFGTWFGFGFTEENAFKDALRTALDNGYRHIDTAFLYKTEKWIGEVLNEYFTSQKLKREDIFVTTKLWPTFMGNKELVNRGAEISLRDLGLDYIDLFILHSPMGFSHVSDDALFPSLEKGVESLSDPTNLTNAWQGLEDLVDAGKLKSIGVSNTNIEQMARIKKIAKHPICCDQVEYHIFLQQPALVDYCSKENIVIVAYAPLGSPGRPLKMQDWSSHAPMEDPLVKQIAKVHNKSEAQILLKFILQRNICIIPKSKTPARVKENMDIFDFTLTDEEVQLLKSLDKNERSYSFSTLKNHVEYPFHS